MRGRMRPARALGVVVAVAALGAPAAPAGAAETLWRDAAPAPSSERAVRGGGVDATRVRTLTLDRGAMATALAFAPAERARPRLADRTVLSLPAPRGGFERFAVQESPVMEPALAQRHPEIRTYSGRGLDDPAASVRLDLTPLGFHASVRSPRGQWYVEPHEARDQSRYVSYLARELEDDRPAFLEHEEIQAAPGSIAPAMTSASSAGDVLRTYRLALVSDPSYATFWGAANVTAGKVQLVNRVSQIYEDELSIRLVLVGENDLLNLNTAALATGTNGPCGAAACFSSTQLGSCSSSTLQRNHLVVGQIVGAGDYDIGHIALGKNGGGVAYLGVVGGELKGGGCTGVPQPKGDFFAVDYVAHEMGHQFAGNHTFNGTQGSCAGGNRNAGTSVEPGSGSSIMAYAGICGQDDTQPHSDPYFSQRSFDEMSGYVRSAGFALDEVETVSLRDFGTKGDSFRLRYGSTDSAVITRGGNYTAIGIKTAVDAILPAGASVSVAGFGGAASPGDTGLELTFGGTLAGTDVANLTLTSPSGMSGFVGETDRGGPPDNGGDTVTPTGNSAPVVSAPGSYTIPARTPFALTGSATDADGDVLTYLWEQNDAGALSGTALVSNTKTNGPLFRQFGTALDRAVYDPALSPSPGENATTTDPTRVFPDMAQILAGNTNAATGSCPAAPATGVVPAAVVDCYSEFLPAAGYVGPLHFRLTARDGAGGVGTAETTVGVASAAGPFRITSQAVPVTYAGGSTQNVTWNVAGTSTLPVSASAVNILLSTDGGVSFPTVLAGGTPNDGGETVVIPSTATTHGRIKVEAAGNVFFDISDAVVTITAAAASSQTITFPPIANRRVDAPSFDPGATASSGLPVSYTAAGPCAIAGGQVDVTGVGTCKVTAKQAGNASWAPAPSVLQSFKVTPIPTTTTIAAPSTAAPGASVHLSSTVTSSTGTPSGGKVRFKDTTGALLAEVPLSGGAAAADVTAPGTAGAWKVYAKYVPPAASDWGASQSTKRTITVG